MESIIEKIKNHKLGNQEEAFEIYFSLCKKLKEKYGTVDKDYDENPTKRGKEWIDIHHVLEYKLDDIAKRTKWATMGIEGVHTLEQLKPYNRKEELVYANKIEHFLLHYLIDSIRGKDCFSGGPNFLWDAAVSLDVLGFIQDFRMQLQKQKEKFYSRMSSEEITCLYKKLIDWKCWDIEDCYRYWDGIGWALYKLKSEEVSFIKDNEKFFKLLDILHVRFSFAEKNKILTLPYKGKEFDFNGIRVKLFNGLYHTLDEKTAVCFCGLLTRKSLKIPSYIEKIEKYAFIRGFRHGKVIIPRSVNEIADTTFIDLGNQARVKEIVYEGTKTEWDSKFSNVKVPNIKVLCKKKKKEAVENEIREDVLKSEEVESLKGKWKAFNAEEELVIQGGKEGTELSITFKNITTNLSFINRTTLIFELIKQETAKVFTYYIHIVKDEIQTKTALIISKYNDILMAIKDGEHIWYDKN